MKTYIQDWLGSRLGIVVDLSPEHFGRQTKDGRLLANLLYSYGVIPVQILNTIKPSKNVNDCYNNLKALKPWLEYLDVPVKDEALYEVASGQGSTAIHLFFALYLSLQDKDRLHHLSCQKERRYSEDLNKRQIRVEKVPENEVSDSHEESETDLAAPLIQKRYMIDRHKEKCCEILEKIKSIKENYGKAAVEAKTELGPITSRYASSKKISRRLSEIETTERDIQAFDEKHLTQSPDLNYQELIDLQNQVNAAAPKSVPNFKEARGYMNSIKQKTRRGILAQSFQEDMQKAVIDELYNRVKKRQDDEFEEIVCRNLLRQSQYEKQMCTKLALMRRQKDVLARNRQMLNTVSMNGLIQKEFDENVAYKLEMAAEDAIAEEFEQQRRLELHKRMYVEKVQRKFQERLEEAKSVLGKLVDIAVRICEFREAYACEIPKHLMKDMKELFFKDLPIFDLLENVGDLYRTGVCGKGVHEDRPGNEGEEYGERDEVCFGEVESEETFGDEWRECRKDEDSGTVKAGEFIRQEVLNECDLNDYMFLLGPWTVEMLLPDEVTTEESQVVLGYIVHKMLACKYPVATVPLPADIKPMYPRCIVQGSNDECAFSMLSELMTLRRILVVRADDAINFVLRAYKAELSSVRDIDITFQAATKSVLKGTTGTEKAKESTVKEQLLKREMPTPGSVISQEPVSKEVSTQTPRKIPDDDPLLSPNAEVGRSAFEALGIGDPVPDFIVVAAIIAYVLSQQDGYDGWVLWNYPVLYSQAVKLEFALTGCQLVSVDDELNTVEGVEGFRRRGNFKCPAGQAEFAEERTSRLVPKPEDKVTPPKAESYFTSFVRLCKKNGNGSKSNVTGRVQGQDAIEIFYTEQQVFHTFEYASMTFQTVKEIGKVVLGEGSTRNESNIELVPKTSLEIFGDGVLDLNEKYSPPKKKTEKDAKKPAEMTKKEKKEPAAVESLVQDFPEETKVETGDKEVKKVAESSARAGEPGSPDWEWATGEQPEGIQKALATFWENLEAVFIEDFKFLFFCLRVHRASTVRYKAFLRRALQTYLRREDTKQSILSDFQHKFNDIDDDLRPDCDVKCELHVRVSELEEVLLEIADERRAKSEAYRVKFLMDNWVANEISYLVNLYIRACQLEADRCVDTCQFINDYYLSLQQKLPPEKVLQKMYAPILQINERNFSVISVAAKNANPSSVQVAGKGSKLTARKSKNEKGGTGVGWRASSCSVQEEAVSLPSGADAIYDILVNVSFPRDGTTPYHQFFLEVVDDLRNSVKETVESCLSESRKGGAGTGGGKDKKRTSETKVDGGSHAVAEWTAALESELSRFLYRMRLIRTRALLDFNDFIADVLDTLTSLTEEMEDIANREIRSISECCKVFRCAIEREVAVQPRLELNVDEFVINQSFLLIPDSSVRFLAESNEPNSKQQFTIEQLTFMCKKLQFIAPDGEIIRRAFLYILEDLRVMKSEDGIPRLLPELWDDLHPDDLPFIFDRVYQRIEVVNWKDFVIYALELPVPTDLEILTMRSSFRAYDPSGTELVSLGDLMRVDFWFENYSTRFDSREVKEFLFKMYQVDEELTNYTALLLAFCKDYDPINGFVKALTLSAGKRITIDEDMTELLSREGVVEDEDEEDYEDGFEDEGNATEDPDSVSSYSGGKVSRKCRRCVRYPCLCKDPSEYPSASRISGEAGEEYDLYFDEKESFESLCTSDVSSDVVERVMLASYPSLPQLSALLSCRTTFKQTLDGLVESLSADGVTVKVSKLLRSKFIVRVLSSTNKFRAMDMQTVVKSMVEARRGNFVSGCSLSWS